MSSITYGVSKGTYTYKNATRQAYGLVAYADAEIDGTVTIVASANDLSCDESKLQELANKCNEGFESFNYSRREYEYSSGDVSYGISGGACFVIGFHYGVSFSLSGLAYDLWDYFSRRN